MFILWLLCLLVVHISKAESHVKQKVDIDQMTGDEIAAMALESKKNNPKEDHFGPTLSHGFGKSGADVFEGMDLPDEVRNEIEQAVHDTMKKILEKAKHSKALRKIIREELKEQGTADGIATKELFGDFGWDIAAEEEDDSEEEESEFNETSYFEEEFDNNDKTKKNINKDENYKDEL